MPVGQVVADISPHTAVRLIESFANYFAILLVHYKHLVW